MNVALHQSATDDVSVVTNSQAQKAPKRGPKAGSKSFACAPFSPKTNPIPWLAATYFGLFIVINMIILSTGII